MKHQFVRSLPCPKRHPGGRSVLAINILLPKYELIGCSLETLSGAASSWSYGALYFVSARLAPCCDIIMATNCLLVPPHNLHRTEWPHCGILLELDGLIGVSLHHCHDTIFPSWRRHHFSLSTFHFRSPCQLGSPRRAFKIKTMIKFENIKRNKRTESSKQKAINCEYKSTSAFKRLNVCLNACLN